MEELGIKELLPAFRDPTLQPKDLLSGVSFASGGAGYDPLTSKIAVRAFYTLYLFYFFGNFLCNHFLMMLNFQFFFSPFKYI